MPPENKPKPSFEPPPWETEAFERFRQEQERARSQQDLDDALREIHAEQVPAAPSQPDATEPEPGPGLHAAPEADPEPTPAPTPAIPDARVEAMLIDLRLEEPQVRVENRPLVYAISGVLTVAGVAIVIQGIVLFSRVGTGNASATMLAALASLIMLLVGAGFVAGAVALFRKYHR